MFALPLIGFTLVKISDHWISSLWRTFMGAKYYAFIDICCHHLKHQFTFFQANNYISLNHSKFLKNFSLDKLGELQYTLSLLRVKNCSLTNCFHYIKNNAKRYISSKKTKVSAFLTLKRNLKKRLKKKEKKLTLWRFRFIQQPEDLEVASKKDNLYKKATETELQGWVDFGANQWIGTQLIFPLQRFYNVRNKIINSIKLFSLSKTLTESILKEAFSRDLSSKQIF